MVEHMPLSLANEALARIHEGKPPSRILTSCEPLAFELHQNSPT
jgi:hypothetical protein